MKVAIVQLKAGTQKAKNIKRAEAFIHRAAKAGAKFVLLPEVFNFRGKINSRRELMNVAEKIPGPSSKALMEVAKKNKIHLLIGSLYEKVDGKGKAYNTSILINPRGEISARYRKMNLFSADLGAKRIRESDQFLKGKKGVVGKVERFKIGLSVCYDLRFPRLYQKYAAQGADVLTVPSCFTKTTGKAHWEALLRARAIENLSFVLAPNQVGRDNRGIECYGHSMIISPWGEILARASGNKEQIIYASLDRRALRKARTMLPAIKH